MTNSTGAKQRAVEPQMRASDADRDTAADLLGAAFAEGRLTADEHRKRVSAAYAARSWQQLRRLTADLPPIVGHAGHRAASAMPTQPDWCLIYLLLIVFPPAGIALWLLSRRSPDADPPGRLTAARGLAVTTEPLLSDRAGARCC